MSLLVQKSLILLGVAGSTVGLSLSGSSPEVSEGIGLEMRLPYVLNDWFGKAEGAGEAETRMLPPDTEIKKMIYHPRNDQVDPLQVTIVLSGKDRTSIHRPEVCLTAQGWNIETSQTREVLLSNTELLSVRVLGVSKEIPGEARTIHGHYTYWFVSSDSTTEDHLKRILSTTTRGLLYQSNPRWAYISILSIGAEQESPERWIAEAVPQFQNVFTPASYF